MVVHVFVSFVTTQLYCQIHFPLFLSKRLINPDCMYVVAVSDIVCLFLIVHHTYFLLYFTDQVHEHVLSKRSLKCSVKIIKFSTLSSSAKILKID